MGHGDTVTNNIKIKVNGNSIGVLVQEISITSLPRLPSPLALPLPEQSLVEHAALYWSERLGHAKPRLLVTLPILPPTGPRASLPVMIEAQRPAVVVWQWQHPRNGSGSGLFHVPEYFDAMCSVA
ncbi:hypothetical protein E2C01_042252 [Portunus trituberculatus]|uniref:Uncharacterized protein n=1 Tax=Portunus trituberculatus TaxID=210409 RepID=A0A5B7FT63_PORTR|nr:hypothetical protein [Portunus trituberculatus]